MTVEVIAAALRKPCENGHTIVWDDDYSEARIYCGTEQQGTVLNTLRIPPSSMDRSDEIRYFMRVTMDEHSAALAPTAVLNALSAAGLVVVSKEDVRLTIAPTTHAYHCRPASRRDGGTCTCAFGRLRAALDTDQTP